jgi:hypothetical protein
MDMAHIKSKYSNRLRTGEVWGGWERNEERSERATRHYPPASEIISHALNLTVTWLPRSLEACEVMVYQVKGACTGDDIRKKKKRTEGALWLSFVNLGVYWTLEMLSKIPSK